MDLRPRNRKMRRTNRTRKLKGGGLPALILAALVAAASYFFGPGQNPFRAKDAGPEARGDVTVAKVYDGDTLLLSHGEKVRLIGIDCPETHENTKLFKDARRTGEDIEVIKTMGRKAKKFTNDLAMGRRARLEFDVERKDRYGRSLAYVFILKDGSPAPGGYAVEFEGQHWYFLNAAIIGEGYATPMTIPPNVKYAEVFSGAFAGARDSRKGLWREHSPPPLSPPKPARAKKRAKAALVTAESMRPEMPH